MVKNETKGNGDALDFQIIVLKLYIKKQTDRGFSDWKPNFEKMITMANLDKVDVPNKYQKRKPCVPFRGVWDLLGVGSS